MPIDARRIKDSFALVEAHGQIVIEHFYAHLFAHVPHLRGLFPISMSEQRDRLFRALALVAQKIDDLDSLAPVLAQLGRDHRKFDVLDEYYDAVGASLLATLELFAGDAWTAEVAAAWTEAYDLAARVMQDAANDGDAPPYWLADVVAHDRRAWDLAVITVRPREPYPYQAGQYLSVETPQWPKLWRTYSIGNAPRPDGTLDLHVKQVDQGQVSWAFVDQVRGGDVIKLGPPLGTMVLTDSPCDLLLIAGGTGLSPLKAIIEQVSRVPAQRGVHLFVGARHADRLYDLHSLTVLAARNVWLSVTPVISDDPAYPGRRGLVGEVAAAHQSWLGHEAYVCGPPRMVTATIRALTEAGLPHSRIHHDSVEVVEIVKVEAEPTKAAPAKAPSPFPEEWFATSDTSEPVQSESAAPRTKEDAATRLANIRELIQRRRAMRVDPRASLVVIEAATGLPAQVAGGDHAD